MPRLSPDRRDRQTRRAGAQRPVRPQVRHVEGYTYSSANKNSGITWDEATFQEYIKDPRAKIPGTKMVYAGLKDEKRINDLIAYLHQFDKAPVKLAE